MMYVLAIRTTADFFETQPKGAAHRVRSRQISNIFCLLKSMDSYLRRCREWLPNASVLYHLLSHVDGFHQGRSRYQGGRRILGSDVHGASRCSVHCDWEPGITTPLSPFLFFLLSLLFFSPPDLIELPAFSDRGSSYSMVQVRVEK